MAIREVPKSYEYACDQCGRKHTSVGMTGHYTNSRPPGWATLKFDRDVDATVATEAGSEVPRHARVDKLLCVGCADSWQSLIPRVSS